MKRILAGIITFLIVCSISCSNEAFARVSKQQQELNKRYEYLNLAWWERFNDPLLVEYMQEVYSTNNDLKIAALRVKEGEKIVKMSLANELPRIGFDGSIGRVMPSGDQWFGHIMRPSYSQYEMLLPLTASYEVDIWGKNRFKTKSIEKQLEMIHEDERATYIALTSSFAAQYYNLIKMNKLLEVQKEIVEIQKEITEKAKKKYQNGLTDETEFINEQKALTISEENFNNMEKSKKVLENQLRVFLSNSERILKTSEYENLTIPENIPSEFTSSVIEQRPDYKRSETFIKKIGCDVSVAKRAFLPTFTIYGQLGFSAYKWDRLFTPNTQMANAGILPSVDLFSGGRKVAFMKLKKYQYEEAVEQYKKTILTSLQEVNDNSVIYQTAEKNYKQNSERARLESRKCELMEHKNEIGAASDYEVLYNKKLNLIAQKEEIASKINYLISIISLYKAVGGQDLYNLEVKKDNV